MTYDPLAYGQVRLDGQKKAPAASPEDILFAGGGAAAPPAAAQAPDDSWQLLDADVTNLLPNAQPGGQDGADFGAEILGESAAAAPRAAARRRGNVPVAVTAPPPAAAARRAAPGASRIPAPAHRSGTAFVVGRPRSARRSAVLVPAAVFAAGGTVTAWLCAMQQNLVLAGLVGALSLVGTAFTRVWLRR